MDSLNIPYFHFTWGLKLLILHKCHCSHPTDSWLKPHPLSCNRPRKELHCQKWGPYKARRPFSKLIHTLQLSSEAAMLSRPSVKTCPPPPAPSFLLAQNLSPKDIARSDITSWKLYYTYTTSLAHCLSYKFHLLSLTYFFQLRFWPTTLKRCVLAFQNFQPTSKTRTTGV